MKRLSVLFVICSLFVNTAFADEIEIKKIVSADNMRFGSTANNKSVVIVCESGFFNDSAKIVLENSKGELTVEDTIARFSTVRSANIQDISPGFELSEEASFEVCNNKVKAINLKTINQTNKYGIAY